MPNDSDRPPEDPKLNRVLAAAHSVLSVLAHHEDILRDKVSLSADEAFKDHPQRDQILELDAALDALDVTDE